MTTEASKRLQAIMETKLPDGDYVFEALTKAEVAVIVKAARREAYEKAAKALENEADLMTNSLHCGDSSMMISSTHSKARSFKAAASFIRRLAEEDKQ